MTHNKLINLSTRSVRYLEQLFVHRSNKLITTYDIIRLIGSPFRTEKDEPASDDLLVAVYEKAFADRVAPLYLKIHRREGWHNRLEKLYLSMKKREKMTKLVLSDLAALLNEHDPNGYVIFKSLKPYPAIPNDTDVLILGDKKEFTAVLDLLYSKGYQFHEWAPLQTTVYDPRGKRRIGVGKKGGIYYIDIYWEISTDYFSYLSKEAIRPYITGRNINGVNVKVLQPEAELAIILFHNIFPEKTFQLEHFYMPLYYLSNCSFDLDVFVSFAERNKLVYALRTNLSIVEFMHSDIFSLTPKPIKVLLDQWGRNKREVNRFIANQKSTPYLFSGETFWLSFLVKLEDVSCLRSLLFQLVHMLNPVFFWDVAKTLKKRFSERGVYHLN